MADQKLPLPASRSCALCLLLEKSLPRSLDAILNSLVGAWGLQTSDSYIQVISRTAST